MSLSLDDEVRTAYTAVRADSDPTNWAVFKYDDSGKKIVVAGTGSDGYSGLIGHFQPEERAYAFYRVQTGDDLSTRAKFVFIAWVGEKVSPLKKARVSTDKAVVKEVVRVRCISASCFLVEIFSHPAALRDG
eukprot:TRINITY_DN162_c0_g1_i2.p1 TRINITY_DN162_c0_g1~~TRINITY_DN162_c0_g1_i2.p1  ORF type:complete len:153 (-),score=47.02 TRINITY_DN162_c0_g1_i2:229-624(-)